MQLWRRTYSHAQKYSYVSDHKYSYDFPERGSPLHPACLHTAQYVGLGGSNGELSVLRPSLVFTMAPYNLQDQAKVREAILRLHALGTLSIGAIAKHPEVGRSKSTVQYIIKAFLQRQSMESKKKRGRPVAMTKRYNVVIFNPFPLL